MQGADYIYMARARAGLTQVELAERVGMTQSEISRLESGRVRTAFETVRALVRACGFELDVSLARADDSYVGEIEARLACPPAERVRRGVRHAQTLQALSRGSTPVDE